MAYTIEYTASAEGDIAYFRKYEQVLIVDAIDDQLIYEPHLETRNRKVLDPNPLAALGTAHRSLSGVLRCGCSDPVSAREGGGVERTQHTLHSWEGICTMRTIELTTIAQPVEDLLDLADAEGVLLRLPNGKVFLLTSVTDAAAEDDDFADEVARTRQNAALMQLLRERSQEQTRYSTQQVRERLGLSKP